MTRMRVGLASACLVVLGSVASAQAPATMAQAIQQARDQVQTQAAIVARLPEYLRLKELQDHLKTLEALAADKSPAEKK